MDEKHPRTSWASPGEAIEHNWSRRVIESHALILHKMVTIGVFSGMKIRRLSWAGIEVSLRSIRVMLYPLEDVAPLRAFLGGPREPLVHCALDERTWIAVTHLHPDHCDRRLLQRSSGRVLCHEGIYDALKADGIQATGVAMWRPWAIGPLTLTAVPSQDWRGDDQVAWIVQGGGRTLIHCGDTIWHGGWYEIARRHPRIDLALVPINGVVASLQGLPATEVPATLTPEQAVEAAIALQARRVCATHYALFDNPPIYCEQPDAVGRFLRAAARRSVDAVAPGAGQAVCVGAA